MAGSRPPRRSASSQASSPAAPGSSVSSEPRDRVSGPVGVPGQPQAGNLGEAGFPLDQDRCLARGLCGVVAPAPGFERGDRPEDALLADLHVPAEPTVLQIDGAD